MAAAEKLGDLHRVERRALAEVVRHAPQGKAVLHRRVLADPADEGGVIAHAFDRRDVAAILPLIDQHPARSLAQDRLRLLDRQRAFELAVRSEEHTSERQSLMSNSYAVFCLKKKKKTAYNA